MFNSGSSYAEGRKDGYGGYPPNRGWYFDQAWLDYERGYADGIVARHKRDLERAA